MPSTSPYQNITELSHQIARRIVAVEQGECDLDDLEAILADIRALEERIIVIRYKGIERLRYAEQKRRQLKEKPHAPELPLELDPSEEASQAVEQEEMVDIIDSNQISLIDSIEEISRDTSINERMQGKRNRSLAQSLQSKPIESISKALNINQRMGLIKHFFAGDEGAFKSAIAAIEQADNEEQALGILAEHTPDEPDAGLLKKMTQLISRRYA